ncbi:MAG: hypothetical protein HFACDABA_01400 [Anaerolineales bacterium]|nr:hypothetical protein [Anaerolineales bacterium]
MKKFMRVIILGLIEFAITACSGSASVGYQPPNLPIKISIDTNGHLSVSWENSIQTPIGTFSAEVSSDLSVLYLDRSGVLIVNVNGVNSVYDLDDHNNISISLESGYYRQVELRKSGNNWYFEAERISVEAQNSDTQPNNSTYVDSSNSCGGTTPSKIKVNKKAYVCTKTDRLIVREVPGGSEILRLYPQEKVFVVGGPKCLNSATWWNIRIPSGAKSSVGQTDLEDYFYTSSEVTGWVMEGGDYLDPYYLCQ